MLDELHMLMQRFSSVPSYRAGGQIENFGEKSSISFNYYTRMT